MLLPAFVSSSFQNTLEPMSGPVLPHTPLWLLHAEITCGTQSTVPRADRENWAERATSLTVWLRQRQRRGRLALAGYGHASSRGILVLSEHPWQGSRPGWPLGP